MAITIPSLDDPTLMSQLNYYIRRILQEFLGQKIVIEPLDIIKMKLEISVAKKLYCGMAARKKNLFC